MMFVKKIRYITWRFVHLLPVLLLLLGSHKVSAQEPPPRPIRINATAQILRFGAFYLGASGGTVIIAPAGTRTSTGDVVLLGMGFPFSAALFEVHAQRGTVVGILLEPSVTLTGTPSGSMTLHIDSSNPTSPFVSTVNFNIAIPLYVGGTLTVGNSFANPPGSYTGTFYVTIVRE
jgi:Domain of unknown function (DUF4402)